MNEKLYTVKMTGNSKLGYHMPVINTSFDQCSNDCVYKQSGTCYAIGRVDYWNNKREKVDLETLGHWLGTLPERSKIRLFEMGDIPTNDIVNFFGVLEEWHIKRKLQFFGFTHHKELSLTTQSSWSKFHIRQSIECMRDNIDIIQYYLEKSIPFTLTVKKLELPIDRKIGKKRFLTCPNTFDKQITCTLCSLCLDKKNIIIFNHHGDNIKTKKIESMEKNFLDMVNLWTLL